MKGSGKERRNNKPFLQELPPMEKNNGTGSAQSSVMGKNGCE